MHATKFAFADTLLLIYSRHSMQVASCDLDTQLFPPRRKHPNDPGPWHLASHVFKHLVLGSNEGQALR
jgi:hypothetical protein